MCWLSKPESMSRNQALVMVGWSLSNMFAGQYITLGCGLLLREVQHLDYSHQTRNYKYLHARACRARHHSLATSDQHDSHGKVQVHLGDTESYTQCLRSQEVSLRTS